MAAGPGGVPRAARASRAAYPLTRRSLSRARRRPAQQPARARNHGLQKVVWKVLRVVEASSLQKPVAALQRAAAAATAGSCRLLSFGLACAGPIPSFRVALRACVAPMSLRTRSGMFQACGRGLSLSLGLPCASGLFTFRSRPRAVKMKGYPRSGQPGLRQSDSQPTRPIVTNFRRIRSNKQILNDS